MFLCVKTHLLVLTVTLGGPLSLAFSSLPSSSFLPLFLFSFSHESYRICKWSQEFEKMVCFSPPLVYLFPSYGSPCMHWPYILFNNQPLIPSITLAQIVSPRAILIKYFHSALKENDANNKVTFSIMTYKLRKRVVATLKNCLTKRKNDFTYKKAEWGIHS